MAKKTSELRKEILQRIPEYKALRRLTVSCSDNFVSVKLMTGFLSPECEKVFQEVGTLQYKGDDKDAPSEIRKAMEKFFRIKLLKQAL